MLARRCLMARLESSRCSFNPETLSQIALIVDDVWKELSTEGAHDASLGFDAGRTYVARKVFQLAQAQWSAIQIKQLLLRALRNEISLRRRETSTSRLSSELGGSPRDLVEIILKRPC
jgi:hypothetical protein